MFFCLQPIVSRKTGLCIFWFFLKETENPLKIFSLNFQERLDILDESPYFKILAINSCGPKETGCVISDL